MPTSWNEEAFLPRLRGAVDSFDRDGVARLCNELIAALQDGFAPSNKGSKAILNSLRRKCYFDLMERVAEAMRFKGFDDAQVRRQYAQSLIDQGKTQQAIQILEPLIVQTKDEHAEARGLLGRVYKQLYVNEVKANSAESPSPTSRLNLQRAVDAYHKVYDEDPAGHLWHGINVVALVKRAAQHKVPLAPEPDADKIARQILGFVKNLEAQGKIGYWDMATAAEACVALGDQAGALEWIGKYVLQEDADAFELSSTERQLREVWGLTIEQPPGSLLLPVLQSQILERKGGQVNLDPGTVDITIRETEKRASDAHLQKILGKEGVVTLKWYKDGLERCQAVAQVLNSSEEGFGTGFLLRGGDLASALGDELVLLTNSHVISNDPAVQQEHGSLSPDDAIIRFEDLPSAAKQDFKVGKLLWTSPPSTLDATLLRLKPGITKLKSYPIAPALPVIDGVQKAYVIGHPGGRTLSLSLQDNVLLDQDGRLIHYRTPTEGGSSGSPVFNQQWKLIGLHHAGSLEMKRLNGKSGTYPANEGIWIQKIIATLKKVKF